MLCEKKKQAIIHWFNSVIPVGISSLEQLKDGDIFRRGLKDILESTEMALPSSSKCISFIKEGDAEENFERIKKYIDDIFCVKSEDLIVYSDCISGKEEELAKVAIFVLSIVVQCMLEKNHEHLNLLSHLETGIQQEIMECLSLVLEHPTIELKRTEFTRILSRGAKTKEPLRRTHQSPVKLSTTEFVTPKARGRPRSAASSQLNQSTEETPVSPLMKMLETPKMKIWSALASKDREILNLRKELESHDNKIVDQRCSLYDLRREIEKKNIEIKQLKEKYRRIESENDEMMARNLSMREKLTTKDLFQNKTVEMYKMEINLLNKEVESWKKKTEDANERIRFLEDKDPSLTELCAVDVAEIQMQLEMAEEKNDSRTKEIEKLREDLQELQETLAVYQEKLLEKNKDPDDSSKCLDGASENLGSVIDEEYRKVRQTLTEKEVENIRLMKQLKEKTDICKKLEAKENLVKRISTLLKPRDVHSASQDSGKEPKNCDIEDQDVDVFFTALNEIRRLTRDVVTAYLQKDTTSSQMIDDLEKESPDPIECVNYIQYVLQELLQQIKTSSTSSSSLHTEKDANMSVEENVTLKHIQTKHEVEIKRIEAEKEELIQENKRIRGFCKDELKWKDKYLSEKNAFKENLSEQKAKYETCKLKLKDLCHEKNVLHQKYEKLKMYIRKLEDLIAHEQESAKKSRGEVESLQTRLKETECNLIETTRELNREKQNKKKLTVQMQILKRNYSDLEQQLLEAEKSKTELEESNATITSELNMLKQQKLNMLKQQQDKQVFKQEVFLGIQFNGEVQSQTKVLNENGVDTADESILSGSYFNRSMHSTFMNDDEDYFMNHSNLPQQSGSSADNLSSRIQELERRNTLCMPHLRTSYPVETQGYTANKRASADPPEDEPHKKVHRAGGKEPPKKGSFFRSPLTYCRQMQRHDAQRKKFLGISKPRMKL